MLQEKNPSSGLRFEREKNASTKKTNAKKLCASYFYQSETYMLWYHFGSHVYTKS